MNGRGAHESFGSAGVGLGVRLEGRRAEIEQAILARAYSVSNPTEAGDPMYVEGLKMAVSAALRYGIAGLGAANGDRPLPPGELFAQARHAARSGISLDIVLRRYFAGYALLADFIVQEAEEASLPGLELQRVLRAEAMLFDRLLVTVSNEYNREADGRLCSAEQRRTERVKRLLNGESVDTSSLDCEFEAHHLGAIASGPKAPRALRDLAVALDCHLFLVRPGEGVVWAWFGGRRPIAAKEALRLASRGWPSEASLAVGEPAQGMTGWRLTHHQAMAALPVALRGPQAVIRYADVALLAAALRDDVLAESLRQAYLMPLENEHDGGRALRQTLRAYLAAGRNVSSAAAALRVSRQTVKKRVGIAEEKIGQPLDAHAAEIETALRLPRQDSDSVANLQSG